MIRCNRWELQSFLFICILQKEDKKTGRLKQQDFYEISRGSLIEADNEFDIVVEPGYFTNESIKDLEDKKTGTLKPTQPTVLIKK